MGEWEKGRNGEWEKGRRGRKGETEVKVTSYHEI